MSPLIAAQLLQSLQVPHLNCSLGVKDMSSLVYHLCHFDLTLGRDYFALGISPGHCCRCQVLLKVSADRKICVL